MKIMTLNASIKHERDPKFDDQRFEALSNALDELADGIVQEIREQYICSHLGMLHSLDARLEGLSVCGNLAILHYFDEIRYVLTDGLDQVGVTKALIACVKK